MNCPDAIPSNRSVRILHLVVWLAIVWTITIVATMHAFAQRASLGVIAGAGLESFRPVPASISYFPEPNPGALIAGATLQLALNHRFSMDVDALRRSVRHTSYFGTVSTGAEWQFPLLLKYTHPSGTVRPFVELGPSFMPSQSAQYGIAIGAGAEFNRWKVRLTPTLRYSRWADNQARPSTRDQIDFLVGVSPSSNSPWAFGRRLSLGAVTGVGLTRAFRTSTFYIQGVATMATPVESQNIIAGLAVEFDVRKGLSIELDGLYRPLHVTGEDISLPGPAVRTNESFSVLTWEFPVLVKYQLPRRSLKPFVEAGPSFRASGNVNSFDPSHYGVAAGMGIEIPLRKLKASPAIRYTHWQADRKQPGTVPNQAELIAEFSF